MTDAPHILYLGRSRLHRARANLIQTLHTAGAFQQLGWRVRVFLPPWRGRLSVAAALAELGIDAEVEVRGSKLLHPRWSFRLFVLVHRRMLQAAPVLYTRVAGISLALARAGLPHHLEVHDVAALAQSGEAERILAYHRTGLIRTLIPISRAAAQSLAQSGAAPARVHVAPSGVRLEAFARLPPFDPARLECPRIVHLGRLSAPRGLAVFQHFAVRGECEITVVSPDRSAVLNAAHHPPVPLADVPGWYARSDVTLLPYQPDLDTAATMSPIKMFEAMAAGRPIIASDLPTLREVLEHERTALLVRPDDLNAWAEALERLRRDRALALALARNARAEAEQYSWRARASGIARAIGLTR